MIDATFFGPILKKKQENWTHSSCIFFKIETIIGQNSNEFCIYQIVKLGIKDLRKPVIEKTINLYYSQNISREIRES